MATVFLATDRKHDRRVAIKIINNEAAAGTAAERFQREVRLLARLQHPNLLPVFDSGIADERLWYAMPFVEGESLRARLERKERLDIDSSISMVEQLADALQYAHSAGVIHRDIKPENILLSHSIPLIADFGIAVALDPAARTRLTDAGTAIGTLDYMSPEQALGDGVDQRSDIYSLGCVAFEMLAGIPPFHGDNPQAVVARKLSGKVPSIRALRPDVSLPLEGVITRAIARNPEDRWPTGGEFSAALSASRKSPQSHSRMLRSRRAAIAAGILTVFVAAGFYIVGESRPGSSSGRQSSGSERDSAAVSAYNQGMARVSQRTQRTLTEGLALIDRAIRLDSGYALAWAGRAFALNWAREWQFQAPGVPRDSLLSRALAASERALDLDSNNATVWFTSATIARAVDPTRRTISMNALRHAIALDSLNARAWQALALDYQDLGQIDSASILLKRAAIISRGTVGAAGYANHFYWRREYDSAAVWSDSAIKFEPRLPYAWEVAGATALIQKRYDDAQSFYEAAIRLDEGPTRIRGLEGLAEVAAARGDTAKALQFISDAEKLVDQSAPSDHAAISLASAYASVGNREKALRWLETYQPRRSLHFQLHLKRDPMLDDLRRERRFAALLR